MGSYKWGHKSPNMGYKYSYPTHNPTYNWFLHYGLIGGRSQLQRESCHSFCSELMRRRGCLWVLGLELNGSFRKLGVPYFGVLTIRIL